MRHETTTEEKVIRNILRLCEVLIEPFPAIPSRRVCIYYVHPAQVACLFRSACCNKIDGHFVGVLNKTVISREAPSEVS